MKNLPVINPILAATLVPDSDMSGAPSLGAVTGDTGTSGSTNGIVKARAKRRTAVEMEAARASGAVKPVGTKAAVQAAPTVVSGLSLFFFEAGFKQAGDALGKIVVSETEKIFAEKNKVIQATGAVALRLRGVYAAEAEAVVIAEIRAQLKSTSISPADVLSGGRVAVGWAAASILLTEDLVARFDENLA